MNLFRKKGLGQVHPGLNRHLRLWDLIILGIGAMVGTGIFTITGTAAANLAGPALIISIVIAAFCVGLSASSLQNLHPAFLQLVEPIATSMPSLESFQPGLQVG